MAERPIIFAMANPDPEIRYELAKETRPDSIVATGRSDYPNQVNNVLGYIPYRATIGTADGSQSVTIGQLDDWGTMRAYRNPTNPATVSGTWFTNGDSDPVSYATGWQVENGNSGAIYVAPFWMALCAAVERGVSGADAAWNVVNANVTNLTTFKNHGAIDPRHHSYPRNK